MSHVNSFYICDLKPAMEVGVECGIVYHKLCAWVKHNINNERNFHDGYHWTYNSAKAFEKDFPFFSPQKIGRLLNKLEDAGYIKKGNYNKTPFDRTCWYACPLFEDEYLGKEKTRSDNGQGVNKSANDNDCIPQSNDHDQGECQSEDEYYSSSADCVTNSEESGETVEPVQETLFDAPEEQKKKAKSKKANKYENEIKEVIDFLNSKVNRNFKPDTGQTVTDLTRWFKKGYKVEDIKQMISFKVNQWKGTDNEQWLIPSTLFRKSNFEGYVEASQGYQDFVSDAERGCINV